MQKIFIATIFIICQLISYSALAITVPAGPTYKVKASDFKEKFNTLNIQYRYNLKPIKKDENFQSKIIYLFKPNIYLDMNSVFELVGRLELTCEQFSNNKLAGMKKCQQSIQLISEAFDPDFKLSDFERNKACTSIDETNTCSYEFNHVKYTLENEQDTQTLRFIISPFSEDELDYPTKSESDQMSLKLIQYYISYVINYALSVLHTDNLFIYLSKY